MTKKIDPSEKKPVGFCVYIGPTILGLIQSGTIYTGSIEEAKSRAAEAIGRYPLVEHLIIPGESLAQARADVSAGNTYLGTLYRRIATSAAKK